MNLDYEVRRILNKHGYYVYYGRRNEAIKCSCNRTEPDPSCQKCLGTGYKLTLEQALTWRCSASIPESLVGVLRQVAPALTHPDAWAYYFEPRTAPKLRDLIIEVNPATLNAAKGPLYVITSVEPMFFDRSGPSFYRVIARSRYGEDG